MKKMMLLLCLVACGKALMAQEEETEEKKRFFKKENLFMGAGATASFFNGITILGVSPFFGYSLNRFLDMAVSLNINYISRRNLIEVGDRVRSVFVGPGGFVRLYPVPFFFTQVQYEYNMITTRYRAAPGSIDYRNQTIKNNVASTLVGAGYCNGRLGTRNLFFYASILWDVSGNPRSPFRDNLNDPIPIIRTGIQIPLFQGQRRRFE